MNTPNPTPVGSHPWADAEGRITPESAAVCVANWILTAGGKASTAFQCALEIAKDLEARGFKKKDHSETSTPPPTPGFVEAQGADTTTKPSS